ncbi:MAG: restriction endonuclease subunit S, partial [Chloroflexota bacterium]
FYLLLHKKEQIASLASGTTFESINKATIETFPVSLPPHHEQRAIAHTLRAVQSAQVARRLELALERERKAALMEHLFTHGMRMERRKQTEIGEVPESWEIVKLGRVARIERGKFAHRPSNDPAFYGGQTPFIQTGDVATAAGRDGRIRTFSQTLNETGLAVSKVFPKRTIVITIAANIGYTGILQFDSAFPDSLIGISPFAGIDTEYLNHYLSTQQAEMDRMAPRGTQKNINIEFLAPWPVKVPPLEQQGEIVAVLSACDAKIGALEREAGLLDELFRAMLEELMTGRLSALPLVEDFHERPATKG